LVPPDDITVSYTYERCVLYSSGLSDHRCLVYAPFVEVLDITPPFAYSYQCGSTLLVAYVPVHIYSVSMQIVSISVSSLLVFSANLWVLPAWVIAQYPSIAWPLSSTPDHLSSPHQRLLSPAQILARVVSQLVLLLSFGLCSPVLGGAIALSVCLTLSYWRMLIGRFAILRPDLLGSGPPSSLSLFSHCPEGKTTATADDELEAFQTYLPACKWAIILPSSLFICLLCWEMAGDSAGWFDAVWVPFASLGTVALLWLWDRGLAAGLFNLGCSVCFSSLPTSTSLEFVNSSLHLPARRG
jgi:hypothetical protein